MHHLLWHCGIVCCHYPLPAFPSIEIDASSHFQADKALEHSVRKLEQGAAAECFARSAAGRLSGLAAAAWHGELGSGIPVAVGGNSLPAGCTRIERSPVSVAGCRGLAASSWRAAGKARRAARAAAARRRRPACGPNLRRHGPGSLRRPSPRVRPSYTCCRNHYLQLLVNCARDGVSQVPNAPAAEAKKGAAAEAATAGDEAASFDMKATKE